MQIARARRPARVGHPARVAPRPSVRVICCVACVAADKFTGESVVHCHILLHEDLGMMGAMHIHGEEGTVWPDAKKYEPTCSSGKYTMV
jgi:hypothetical protein